MTQTAPRVVRRITTDALFAVGQLQKRQMVVAAYARVSTEKEEQEDEIESDGETEENESDKPSVPDNPLDSEPIIDGKTPYLEEYDKYADIIKELLSSYEGQEIPEDVRKIIEDYLELLQQENKNMITEDKVKKFQEKCDLIFNQIERDVIGQKEVVTPCS